MAKSKEKMPVGVMMGLGMDIKLALQRAESLGFTNVQTSSPPDDLLEGQKRKDLVAAIRGSKVKITTMFCGFAGESYADIPTVKKTVGYLTPETREARLARTFKISDVAKEAGVKRVAAHIGFVPEDKNDPNHTAMVEAVQRIADHCKKNGQEFSLETGQEKADVLLEFIHEVNRPNVKVNFDPANMILYGTGEPIPALKVLGKYVVGVHCKDGTWPTEKDKLGHETILGQGKVNIPLFIQTLKEVGYTGPLTIEREITGDQHAKDIVAAREYIEKLKKECGIV